MTTLKKHEQAPATQEPARAPRLTPFSRFETELERLLEDAGLGFPRWWRGGRHFLDRDAFAAMPAIDVIDEQDHVVVKAELPGMAKADITVELRDSTLVIRGEKKHEKETKEASYVRSEREHGLVYRSIHLPAEVDKEGVTAALKDGVLEIRMAKTAAAKRKAVTVPVQ